MARESAPVTATAEVATAPLQVWAVWTDVAAWPRWNPGVRSVTLLDGARVAGPGVRARVRQPQLPAAVYEVTVWEPPRRWVWVARSPGIVSTASHEVRDLGDGRCRVTGSVVHAGPLAPLVALVTGGLARQYVDREVQAVARRGEGGPDLSPPPDGLRR